MQTAPALSICLVSLTMPLPPGARAVSRAGHPPRFLDLFRTQSRSGEKDFTTGERGRRTLTGCKILIIPLLNVPREAWAFATGAEPEPSAVMLPTMIKS
jgi:hypothetical protein